jgi:hypothetical protein
MVDAAVAPGAMVCVRSPTMKLGLNYPWFSYAHDFGGRTSRPWSGAIDADIRHFQDLGLEVVRWFVLCNGYNYGIAAEVPTRETGSRGRPVWRFRPPRGGTQDDAIVNDFDEVLRRFEAQPTGRDKPVVKLMPVILSPSIFEPARGSGERIAGGRADLANDPRKTQVFVDNLFGRLIETAHRHRRHIYAIDLMNEPEWCTWYGEGHDSQPKRTVTLERMRAFLSAMNDKVRAVSPGMATTVGFAHHSSFREFDARSMGLTMFQYHYYGRLTASDAPGHGRDNERVRHDPIPRNRFARGCIMGEIGVGRPAPADWEPPPPPRGEEPRQENNREWCELPHDTTNPHRLLDRLWLLESKNYNVTLLWCYRHREDDKEFPPGDWAASSASAEQRQNVEDDIRNFRAGRRRVGG